MVCLGLEPRPKKAQTEPPVSPFTAMVENEILKKDMFSVFKGKDGSTGEIVFGGFDTNRFHNPVEMINVMRAPNGEYPSWMVKIYEVGCGGGFAEQDFYALVDTGTSTIVLPKLLLEQLPRGPPYDLLIDTIYGNDLSVVPGILPCASRRTLPTLTFGIGSRLYTLSGET